MSTHAPIAYTYEADTHCPDCAEKRFGLSPRGFIAEDATDGEGNSVGVIAPWDEWYNIGEGFQTLSCGTCGVVIETHDEEPHEPCEDDLVTYDHVKVYQYGKVVLETTPDRFAQDVLAFMDKEQFWPNVWFVSDHGNAHLLNVSEGVS
jgi:hypothetical protein